MTEFGGYIRANGTWIPNFGERYRNGETISSAFVESAVNHASCANRSLFAVTPVSSAVDLEYVLINELRLPRSVQDAVQRRTDRLDAPARQLVVLAAIIGRRFQVPLLQQLDRDEL